MNKKTIIIVLLLIIAVLFAAYLLRNNSQVTFIFQWGNHSAETPTITGSPNLPTEPDVVGVLDVIVFDVGQADCILLKTDDHAMLIDAGNINQDKLVLGYLAEYEITELDYLVATHPHADHIGSMASVIMAMDRIDTVIMPNKAHTTKTYENLMAAIEEKDIPMTIPTPGDIFQLGNANIEVVAPNSASYNDDINEYSIVLRVEFGDTSFLFTGDAGTTSENEQLSAGFSLKTDVLKVGHHGSRTSCTQKYLDAVAPNYAVICCGINNPYGHPHPDTMTRLTGTDAQIYRTDQNGTITFTTNGTTITISATQTPITPDFPDIPTEGYIGNKNTLVFHLPSCSSLPSQQNRVYFDTRQEAIDAGYRPCGNCKP
ncbi:MAG: MBL fold metallo-hydrolase [Nitrososphaerota archaeon]|jgi:competence protein ComEC|uniref:MBL fold metallo-hydrolase n=1 Tax=Candidatus Bathycorpusculum sp. TaxID=2994959 RepID=UPI002827AA90|nr:MBL fold metallo-hydrolase [Candidatus Termitimicrobium sp.]MCL2432338.1 MBL fold metallo-hydrolase [Candidatus Termitimicrobium sp.]MDR0493335.1 MBL fold metallo-hydrolase [Nitrososphaerota archaeon]